MGCLQSAGSKVCACLSFELLALEDMAISEDVRWELTLINWRFSCNLSWLYVVSLLTLLAFDVSILRGNLSMCLC